MGFVKPHVLILAAMGVVALALLLQIIGVATAEWVYVTDLNHYGLWKVCSQHLGCLSLSANSSSWLDACRAFGILGILALAASLACGLLIGFMSEQKIFTLLAPLTAAVGAFCIMIEFAVFLGEQNSSSLDFLGYSFALTVTAFVLAAVAAISFFLGRSRSA